MTVDDFRSIYLLNGAYMMVAKVLANRMRQVSGFIVDDNQSAFIPRHSILEGFTIAQELISTLHKDRRSDAILKVYFEKSYDKVDWLFLLYVLSLYGFEPSWLRMIELCLCTATASVVVNGESFGYFHLNRGLRQRDPFSGTFHHRCKCPQPHVRHGSLGGLERRARYEHRREESDTSFVRR
ncbi:hypothetical protein QJS10_CPB19g00366 [Acorus calamus]|uniref:Reverse transcriptase domain-containing protein n=1 Tax=Acorus calamus TaxID=4465 RepID=A0AAV9CJN9_ACOCL|nr:hypothetical protein QJS10_CPB19g00366 [Acorus calamus]